jgi:hypothetical protein
MMAIEQAMKMRGAERFSTVVKGKMAGTPLQIAPGDPAPLTEDSMMVKPSIEDATQAALDETLASDPEAYMAGTSMMGSVMKERAEERKLAAREKIEGQKIASREKIEADRVDQRDRAENKRYEAMMARIEAGNARAERAAGGKGSTSAKVQEIEYLVNKLGMSKDQVIDYVTERKRVPVEDIAAKILSADKFGEVSPEEAMQRAQRLVKARESIREPGASKPAAAPAKAAGPAVKALPAGAKQIGTYQGKPVFQTPDGKKFVQE